MPLAQADTFSDTSCLSIRRHLLSFIHQNKGVGRFMPRTGRIVLAHYPHLIVQRDHNRQVVFARPADYERYLSDLRELKEALGIKVYAYCLITNHVHLLLAPGESTSSLGQLMKALAGRMTRYRNRVEGENRDMEPRPTDAKRR